MARRGIDGFDYILLFATLALIVIGILFIYSSGINAEGVQTSNEYLKQIIWASIGLALMLSAAAIKYDYVQDFAPIIYWIIIALVVLTLFFGSSVKGARNWIGIGPLGIQPSEFLKVGLILYLASFLARRNIREMQSFWWFALALVLTGIPMLLVLMQPDLGTAMVYLPIALLLLFAAGARPLYLLFVVGVLVFTVVFTLLPEWEKMIYPGNIEFFIIFNDKLYILLVMGALLASLAISLVAFLVMKRTYFFYMAYGFLILLISYGLSLGVRWFLKDYQMMRLIVFLDPNIDPRGSGWNIIQSITAVGSGGFAGMGFLNGTQSHYQYLPEQSTDFIFSILSEEWGFVGGLLISGLYLLIIIRGLIIASQARDKFGSYIAIGVVAMLGFHFMVNVGMTIGLMPITGIPLLFLSYGGSGLWTAMISMGLLMSVSRYRFKY